MKLFLSALVLSASSLVSFGALAQTMPAYPTQATAPAQAYNPALAPLRILPYDGGPVPPGMHVISRPREGMILAGALAAGSAWAVSSVVGLLGGVIDSAANRDRGASPIYWLTVPVVGPLLCGAGLDGVSPQAATLLAMSTIAQVGGVAMIVAGFAAPERFLVSDARARNAPRWHLLPGTTAGPQGATLGVTF